MVNKVILNGEYTFWWIMVKNGECCGPQSWGYPNTWTDLLMENPSAKMEDDLEISAWIGHFDLGNYFITM